MCSYHIVQTVIVVEPFSGDSDIDDLDLYYFALGAEIGSTGGFSLFASDGLYYSSSMRVYFSARTSIFGRSRG